MDFLRKVPIGQYVYGHSSWLRLLDPRIKMCWVVLFLITPVLSGPFWRISLVLGLLAITFLSSLPLKIWWRSLVLLTILSSVVGLLSTLLPTSEFVSSLPVRSPQEVSNALTFGSSWELLKIGPFRLGSFNFGQLLVDRRSAELGIKTSTLIFTVIHSVNLMLITTSSEDLVWTLRWFLSPLSKLGFPLERMSFQLLIALRFLPLVQEELQNLLRSIATRAINFRSLGFKGIIGIFLSLGERLLTNILLRADQGADALIARNNTLPINSDDFKPAVISNKEVFLWNIFSSLMLIFVIFLRKKYGQF